MFPGNNGLIAYTCGTDASARSTRARLRRHRRSFPAPRIRRGRRTSPRSPTQSTRPASLSRTPTGRDPVIARPRPLARHSRHSRSTAISVAYVRAGSASTRSTRTAPAETQLPWLTTATSIGRRSRVLARRIEDRVRTERRRHGLRHLDGDRPGRSPASGHQCQRQRAQLRPGRGPARRSCTPPTSAGPTSHELLATPSAGTTGAGTDRPRRRGHRSCVLARRLEDRLHHRGRRPLDDGRHAERNRHPARHQLREFAARLAGCGCVVGLRLWAARQSSATPRSISRSAIPRRRSATSSAPASAPGAALSDHLRVPVETLRCGRSAERSVRRHHHRALELLHAGRRRLRKAVARADHGDERAGKRAPELRVDRARDGRRARACA